MVFTYNYIEDVMHVINKKQDVRMNNCGNFSTFS